MSYAVQQLHNALNVHATREHVAEALGIKEEMTDEFWLAQTRTARHRFYWMCLEACGFDTSTEINDLPLVDVMMITDVAEKYLTLDGFSYRTIRNWYKTRGEFIVAKAFDRRREQRLLDQMCLRVLIIFTKGAKFVSYDTENNVVLVDEKDAHEFPVKSPSELEKPYLLEMSKHFESVAKRLDGKLVKILPGKKTER